MTALHQQLFSMLKAAPFFERLDSADIARLIPYIELQEFAAGESIFNKNQPADTRHIQRNYGISRGSDAHSSQRQANRRRRCAQKSR